MAVEVEKDFCFFGEFFLSFFEVVYDSHDFRKKVRTVGIFVDVPVPVEVVAKQSAPVVACDDSIDVDHGD